MVRKYNAGLPNFGVMTLLWSMLMTIVYILQSLKDPERYYVGRTMNLEARLKQHNSADSGHTVKFRPWQVVVAIHFEDAGKAEAFELYLKSGSGRAFAKKHF